jgi:hypothetical protein
MKEIIEEKMIEIEKLKKDIELIKLSNKRLEMINENKVLIDSTEVREIKKSMRGEAGRNRLAEKYRHQRDYAMYILYIDYNLTYVEIARIFGVGKSLVGESVLAIKEYLLINK